MFPWLRGWCRRRAASRCGRWGPRSVFCPRRWRLSGFQRSRVSRPVTTFPSRARPPSMRRRRRTTACWGWRSGFQPWGRRSPRPRLPLRWCSRLRPGPTDRISSASSSTRRSRHSRPSWSGRSRPLRQRMPRLTRPLLPRWSWPRLARTFGGSAPSRISFAPTSPRSTSVRSPLSGPSWRARSRPSRRRSRRPGRSPSWRRFAKSLAGLARRSRLVGGSFGPWKRPSRFSPSGSTSRNTGSIRPRSILPVSKASVRSSNV